MQSFDVFMPDGRSITAESAGPGVWDLFLFSTGGRKCARIGKKLGTRREAMIYCEGLAESIGQDKEGV